MTKPLRIYTIGYTRKTALVFFQTLQDAGVQRLIDIRLRNTSQMAGFTKRGDLAYFMMSILQAEYVHIPMLAPSEEILDAYMKDGDWGRYEQDFMSLMRLRKVSEFLEPEQFQDACLLCSEPSPVQCHRRLVAEHLRQGWLNVEILHL